MPVRGTLRMSPHVIHWKHQPYPQQGRSRRDDFMAYWLFKSEPECYSFADLMGEPSQITGWDGVRNYQARNFLRDSIKAGDSVFFYHSSAQPPCIAGIAKVVRDGHPDPTAFDPSSDHYDTKSDPSNPTWIQVSIKAEGAFDPPIELSQLRAIPELAGMELLRKGSRLSIQPVTPQEWKTILALVRKKKKR
jgi:predicted RNA-binding protein with PUA-like domain